MKKSNATALLPVLVYLVLYLGLGIIFEYICKIPMGFYNIPIIVAFLAAILVACIQNRDVSFDEKLQIMAGGLLIRILYYASYIPDSRCVCRCCWKKQCRKCGIFYA